MGRRAGFDALKTGLRAGAALAGVALVACGLGGESPTAALARTRGLLPGRVGQCVASRVERVETRLEGMAGSGSAVVLENGGYQVSYDQVPAVDASRPGDPVSMCLVSLPKNCPKGDDRGKTYKTTNLRTKKSWTLPDSEHPCGGA